MALSNKIKQKAKKMFLEISELNPDKHKYTIRDIASKLKINKNTVLKWSKELDINSICWNDIWNGNIENRTKNGTKNRTKTNHLKPCKINTDYGLQEIKKQEISNNLYLKKIKRYNKFNNLENKIITILNRFTNELLNKSDYTKQEISILIKALNTLSNNINSIDNKKDESKENTPTQINILFNKEDDNLNILDNDIIENELKEKLRKFQE